MSVSRCHQGRNEKAWAWCSVLSLKCERSVIFLFWLLDEGLHIPCILCPSCSLCYHQEKKGFLLWKLCVYDSLELFWCDRAVSTITGGVWTNRSGLFPSFKTCVRFKICPRITAICLWNWPLSNPGSFLKSSYRSSSRSLTKFGSEIFGRISSLISWEKGTLACGSHAQ